MAVILGSGWGESIQSIGTDSIHIPAATIPGFTDSPVPGHSGELVSIALGSGKRLLAIGARTHFYQGRDADAAVHAVRTAAACGARVIIVTNGCGSLVPSWGPGTVVLVGDHMNLTGTTPLSGPRFIDMTHAYSPWLRALVREVDPSIPEGVYAQFAGPQYETPAEVRMARVLGADLVGMSTALETIAARAEGMDVLGLSLVTNYAAGMQPGEGPGDAGLNHEEVLRAGEAASARISQLLARVITRISER